MKAAGFNVTHLYGLTEVYGPAVVNDWRKNGMRFRMGRVRREKGLAKACATQRSNPSTSRTRKR